MKSKTGKHDLTLIHENSADSTRRGSMIAEHSSFRLSPAFTDNFPDSKPEKKHLILCENIIKKYVHTFEHLKNSMHIPLLKTRYLMVVL